MLNRSTRFNRQFSCAALIAALVFLLPETADALVIPDEVTLKTSTFAQIMDREEILSWYDEEKHLVFDADRLPEFEATDSICADREVFCAAFISRHTRSHIILSRLLTLDMGALEQSIALFAEKADRDPKNARFKVEDSKVIVATPAENGIIVNPDQSLKALEQALIATKKASAQIELISENVPAKISAETLSTLGISELIGTATTDFRGSPKNRIYNIERALQEFDGIVIEPNAIFSFVDHLGEVDGENGYLPELVIKNNKTEPEFGGGICQVSTTVFRAALQSGLKITERKNHAYAVQYYKPYGLDATIYIPKPDLQFKNNTPGAILLVPEINGTRLTFSMFGTRDGRTSTIDGPHILESNPDGSMKTVFTHIVKDASGNTLINDLFWSNYKSPSLFPHPGDEIYTTKPKGWSNKQWSEYKKIHP